MVCGDGVVFYAWWVCGFCGLFTVVTYLVSFALLFARVGCVWWWVNISCGFRVCVLVYIVLTGLGVVFRSRCFRWFAVTWFLRVGAGDVFGCGF